jgi:hypothetical protein
MLANADSIRLSDLTRDEHHERGTDTCLRDPDHPETSRVWCVQHRCRKGTASHWPETVTAITISTYTSNPLPARCFQGKYLWLAAREASETTGSRIVAVAPHPK